MTAPKNPRRRRPVPYQKGQGFFRNLMADPKRAEDFLKRAKIMDENGELTAPYRRHSSKPVFVADRPRGRGNRPRGGKKPRAP